MFAALRHSLRLAGILRILVRHDALKALDQVDLPPLAALVLRSVGRLGLGMRWRQRGAHDRPGQRLAAALHELGPSFIKLGQALSVRPDLVGADIAEDLGRLRDRLPPFPAAAARATIATELGAPVETLFQSFTDQPVAAASIAQVHFAVTPDGREVAVKVLRPGIEAAFRRDLDLFFWLARLALRLQPRLKRLRPVQALETIAASVALEMDLRLEAAAASELAENFADDPGLRVPKVDWQRTGRRVLTLERVHGIPVDDRQSLIAAGHDPAELAARMIQSFLHQALRDGFFHADLHQGNLFVGADGALEPVDFGIMGRIDRPTRLFMAEMLHAFLTGDWRRAAMVHFNAGYVPAGKSPEIFAQACRSIGEPILNRPVSEISIGRLLAQLFQITETFAMETQPQLLLLQKTMVTAEGVARSLDPEINFWDVARAPIAEWVRENMGPEARVQDMALDVLTGLRHLPALANRLDRLAERLDTGGLRVDEESLRQLARAQAQTRWPALIAVLALGVLAVLLLS